MSDNTRGKRAAESKAVQEYLRQLDGPGTTNRNGIFVTCGRCEHRVFVSETQEPPACSRCGAVFGFMVRHRQRRKENGNG